MSFGSAWSLRRADPGTDARDDATTPSQIRDLASGNPDPRLLPPLRAALDAIDLAGLAVNNVDSVLPELAELARSRFARNQIPVRDVAAFSGALDAMERILLANMAPGARVLVEDPGYPPVFFLLAALGLKAVPFPVDQSGLVPDGLGQALRDVSAVIVTPRAQNPTGTFTSPERAASLRELLRKHPDLLVIEDDHASDIAGPDTATLIEEGRPHWAVVQSVSKSLGVDLRFAVVAADALTIAMVRGRQRRGPGWVSGLLQQIVLHQWTAPAPIEMLRRAKAEYAERRRALISALAEREIEATGLSGLNVWIPVADEQFIVARMLQAGYAVSAGKHFRRSTQPAVRITISSVMPSDADAVACAMADAVTAASSRQPR